MSADWATRFEAVIGHLARVVESSRLTLCGLNACIDARVSLHDASALFASTDESVRGFADQLLTRVRDGIGGEFSSQWAEGPAWLAARAPIRTAFGGTGPHAASVLSCLGAPALLCLGDRSEAMLAHVPPGVLLASGDALVPARTVIPQGASRPEIFIFEYTAGQAVGPVVPSRSSRIIVRFHNPGLEDDPDFETLSVRLAPTAGAGLMSGFNAVPRQAVNRELSRAVPLARAWRDAGLSTVHLELAGYDTRDAVERVLAALRGVVTSVGMSQSELVALEGSDDSPLEPMLRFAARTGVERVAVHADHWAAAITRGDPEHERLALMTGCLVASARAAAGTPVRPTKTDAAASYHALPFAEQAERDGWHFVACASPYLEHPVTTLGLGDTFTAGCLLVLGQGDAGRNGMS